MTAVDTVVTDVFDFDARKVGTLRTVAWDAIGSKDIGVDIGEKTREKFASIVKGAATVVWNEPMGVFEIADTAKGTLAIAQARALRVAMAPSLCPVCRHPPTLPLLGDARSSLGGGGLASSGGRSPRWSRTLRIERWSVRKAMICIFWPQREQTSGST
jgi:hypothetical protein